MSEMPDDLLLNVVQNQNMLILQMVEMLNKTKDRIVELEAQAKLPSPVGKLWTDAVLLQEGARWIPWPPAEPYEASSRFVRAVRFKTAGGQTIIWDSVNGRRE